ncbi:hypothetical protein KCU65_g6607, partial [Aureobasidium melanogenum]
MDDNNDWTPQSVIDKISAELTPSDLLTHIKIETLIRSLPNMKMTNKQIKKICQKMLRTQKPRDASEDSAPETKPSSSAANKKKHPPPHKAQHQQQASKGKKRHRSSHPYRNESAPRPTHGRHADDFDDENHGLGPWTLFIFVPVVIHNRRLAETRLKLEVFTNLEPLVQYFLALLPLDGEAVEKV